MIHRALVEGADTTSARMNTAPFIGRRKELAAIAEFCRDVWEGEELAACWIQGEAGIGKSALMNEAEKRLKGNDRIIIAVRFYPHAVNSVAALTAEGLNADITALRLLTDRVAHTLSGVLTAIRRLARLRPVALIFEDLHLLEGEACLELHSLLEGLRNESLPVLCVSRIAASEAYTRILFHIRKSLEIPPLERNDVEELTHSSLLRSLRVSGAQLYEASRGYPLILQSLIAQIHNLRRSDPDSAKSEGAGLRLLNSRAALSIQGLSEALLSGLTEEEKEGTRRLATLGELFSPQAAALLLHRTPLLIDLLLLKGIIVRSTTFSLPLYGPCDSAIPYRFNHTLLFEELLRQAVVEEEAIIGLIEQMPPLYSLTLFQQLEKTSPGLAEPERLERAIRIILREAGAQESRIAFDQKIAAQMCAYAERLYQRRKEEFTPEQQRLLTLEILAAHVRSIRQRSFSQGEIDRLEEFTRLTASPESERIADYRCLCLSNRLHHSMSLPGGTKEFAEILEEAEDLANRFPSLLSTREFMYLAAYLAGRSIAVDPEQGLMRIRMLFDRIMATADPAVHTSSLSFVGTQILFASSVMSATQRELDETLRFSRTLHDFLLPHCNDHDALVLESIRAYIYLTSGCLSEAMEIFYRYRDPLRYSRDLTLIYVRRSLLIVQAAIGIPLDRLEVRFFEHLKILQETGGLLGNESPDSLPRTQWLLAVEGLTQGYLRGDVRWSEELAARITYRNTDGLRGILPMNRAAAREEVEELRGWVDDLRFGPLVRGAVEPGTETDAAIATIRSFLIRGVIHLPSLLELQTVFDLIGMMRAGNPLTNGEDRLEELRDEMAAAVRQAIDWCIKKRMPGYAFPFLRFGTFYLPAEELTGLSARIERLTEQMPEKIGLYNLVEKEDGDARYALSVIGTIAASGPAFRPGDPLLRFQGARVRRITGLIVANQLLLRPLSLAEFRHIATGMNSDSEKTAAYTRTLLWRVRSVLGSDAIIADGDAPPRFNTDVVRVDLLEAVDLLERCARAVRQSRPRHARKALMSALAVIGEGPVYPTLFDEFFEAARLDFEIRLRENVRATVSLLRREGDLEEAERLLRPALRSMPGDEELTEELAEILGLLGRNAEAVALRRRSEQRMKAA